VTTLEHVSIRFVCHSFPFRTPRLVVRDVKWGDEKDQGMDDKPIWSAPFPNFGDIHHARQDVPHANGHVCKFTTFENLDRLILPAWMFTAATCIRNCPNGYIQRLLDNSCSFHSAKNELMCCMAPATPTCLASVSGDNTDHSRIDVP
jgi:hypothetical protein